MAKTHRPANVMVRLDSETKARLEAAADQSAKDEGRPPSLSREAAKRISESFLDGGHQKLIELYRARMLPAHIDVEDIELFIDYIEHVIRSIEIAKENGDQWRSYIHLAHFPDSVASRADADKSRQSIISAVKNDYQISRAYLQEHGPAPLISMYRRSPVGAGGDESYLQVLKHREHAERVARIEGRSLNDGLELDDAADHAHTDLASDSSAPGICVICGKPENLVRAGGSYCIDHAPLPLPVPRKGE